MRSTRFRLFLLELATVCGLALGIAMLILAGKISTAVRAAPILPPEGYPKLNLSRMTVAPDLVNTGGATLSYSIEVINTGAYTASGVTVADVLPPNTTYNNDATSSVSPAPAFSNGVLTWSGTVGFDSSVLIQFSVQVLPAFEGVLTNTAAISHSSLSSPVLISADATVTDDPFFEISKSSAPAVPGASKPLTYTLSITNLGQDADNLHVTVSDVLPANTSFLDAGPDGTYHPPSRTVTWQRFVSLPHGATDQFPLVVQVGAVPSGTVITNDRYQVENPMSGAVVGEPYTVTVRDPILFIYKETDPFPPGSNREMTYTLTVLNKGSQATDLVIQDTLPAGVSYVRGGALQGSTVSWELPVLDTGESADFNFTVFVGDVAEVPILNSDYQVCSAEGVCQAGIPITSTVKGPDFTSAVILDPIAKKPGGGGGPVTPTITIENLGPGNALDASAIFYFQRISVSMNDFIVIPNSGAVTDGPACGDKCVAYHWVGDIGAGEVVTFTTLEGQSTIGGEEGTHYTATVVVTDTLGDFISWPITVTAVGTVTHYANLIPAKSAPPVIGAGQVMTYSFGVFNSGLSTDVPPYPILADTVPPSVTVVSVSDGGSIVDLGGEAVISWTLPSMGPGERLSRSYMVQVQPDLVSGTLIVNNDYYTEWFDIGEDITTTGYVSHTGAPITTVVREVGLVDSFKVVSPTWALPGPANVLTYVVHIANTSLAPLTGVQVHDQLPWQVSTYQRDAIASSGQLISDIVSLDWAGSVPALSEELITFTVQVDPGYEGPVTNTAVITHSSLSSPVVVQAVAYITNDPVLRISKTATPDPVLYGGELLYTIYVDNLGQQATELAVEDVLPSGASFVPFSASGNGQIVGDEVHWSFPVLSPGEQQVLTFRVNVWSFLSITNVDYWVSSAEGVTAYGEPLTTRVRHSGLLFLPILSK